MVERWNCGLIDAVDLEPAVERFSFSWPGRAGTERLRHSLDRFGLLRPILCIEENEGLKIVAGHRRLAHLGCVPVPVRVLRFGSLPELWDLLLEEHLDSRPLNPVEIGLYATRRMADTGESAHVLAERVLPALGMPPKVAYLDDPLWIAALPERHREAFGEGRLPLQGVRVLARADREDALAILDLVAGSEVGVNKFSELARWILECTWRDGSDVRTWLGREDLAALAGRPEELRKAVRARRYPLVTGWEQSFEADARLARLPRNARLDHPKGFEGGWLTCTVTFSAMNEFDDSLSELLAALRAGALDRVGAYLG